jgi:penicillin-binding protein 2
VSIGQGFNTASPVQMLGVISAVANGGTLVRPRLIAGVEGEDGLIRPVSQPEVVGRLPISARNLALVKEALVGVVGEPGGTGGAARSPLLAIGGKTGTAQVVKLPPGLRDVQLPEEFRDHAWFVAFAPAASPRFAVAVLVEHGGHGGSAAAPLARAIIEEAARRGYFVAQGIPASPPPAPAPPAGPEAPPAGGPLPAPASPGTIGLQTAALPAAGGR